MKFRTEREMMLELALIAVKLQPHFTTDGSQYSLPNGRGEIFVYDLAFLDIQFIEDGRKDCVVQFTSTLVPFAPAFYCLESELEED